MPRLGGKYPNAISAAEWSKMSPSERKEAKEIMKEQLRSDRSRYANIHDIFGKRGKGRKKATGYKGKK
jgi:hypothetical protein